MSAPPRSPAIHPAAVYRPRFTPELLPADLRLRGTEWAVLFALTGRHTVAQVAGQLQLAPGQAAAAFGSLIVAELVVEQRLSLPEYLRGVATTGDPEPKSFAQLLRTAPLRPAASPVVVATGPAGVASPPPSESGGTGRAVVTPAPPTAAALPARAAAATRNLAPPPAFKPLPLEDPAMAPSAPRALSLKALMTFIRSRSADETAGQLDVYRAFLRVDPELLKRHGITTLRFEDDRVIRDAELQQRILGSVESTLGVRCPPEVFV